MAWFSDYLDEDLETGTAAEVEKHLRVCVRCLALADSLRRTIEVCHAYQPSVKPQPLHPSARAELERAWQQTLAFRRGGLSRG